jgi:hypothetical protein
MTAIPALIAQLEAHLAHLGNGRDLRSDNEIADFWQAVTAIRRTISGLHQAGDVTQLDEKLRHLEQRRAAVLAKEAEIEQAIREAVDPATIRDGREKDREFERQRQLRLSLQRLRDGRLLMAPDVAYERPAVLDARILEVTARRDGARASLASHVATAEALLKTEPVTS